MEDCFEVTDAMELDAGCVETRMLVDEMTAEVIDVVLVIVLIELDVGELDVEML